MIGSLFLSFLQLLWCSKATGYAKKFFGFWKKLGNFEFCLNKKSDSKLHRFFILSFFKQGLEEKEKDMGWDLIMVFFLGLVELHELYQKLWIFLIYVVGEAQLWCSIHLFAYFLQGSYSCNYRLLLLNCVIKKTSLGFGFGEMSMYGSVSALNLSWHSNTLGVRNSQTALRCGYPSCSRQTNALAFRGSESMGSNLKSPFGNDTKTRTRNYICPLQVCFQ